MQTRAPIRAWLRHPLTLILLIAAALRIAVTVGASAHHPDEIFQYLEQAHRLVFGYGIVPWEYKLGMRSWLVPIALAGPMKLGAVIAPDSLTYLVLPRLAVAMSTLAIVWAAWLLGATRAGAVMAAFVAAIWFEQVYYASHTLTEVIATAAALPALALLTGDRCRDLVIAGALLALAALVRFHYAPIFALVVAWRCRFDLRGAWLPVVVGAVPVLALSALIDVAMGQGPFAWIVENFRQNVINDASATYGVSGPFYYLDRVRESWRWAFLPIVFLSILGAMRQPQLLVAAIATVVLHMTIGHKEGRFIFLAMTLTVILAALGTAEALRYVPVRWRRHAFIASLGGWAVTSTGLALSGNMRLQWSNEAPALSAAVRAGRDPALCGLATYDMRYWQSGGYSFLHRNVPIYPVSARDELGFPAIDKATLATISGGFNVILTTANRASDMPPDYRLVGCRVPPNGIADQSEQAARAICIYKRAGSCDPLIANPWRLN